MNRARAIQAIVFRAFGLVSIPVIGVALARLGVRHLTGVFDGHVYVAFVAIVFGVAGLLAFWPLAHSIDFVRKGYRVSLVIPELWAYEELGSNSPLMIARRVIGTGYPAPCQISVPSETEWALKTPAWARHRRAEILWRIADCFGASIGGRVVVLDTPGPMAR